MLETQPSHYPEKPADQEATISPGKSIREQVIAMLSPGTAVMSEVGAEGEEAPSVEVQASSEYERRFSVALDRLLHLLNGREAGGEHYKELASSQEENSGSQDHSVLVIRERGGDRPVVRIHTHSGDDETELTISRDEKGAIICAVGGETSTGSDLAQLETALIAIEKEIEILEDFNSILEE